MLNSLASEIHQTALNHGFWESENKAEKIALMHSELSEALEAIRKPCQDDKCPAYTGEEVELADAVIRILDYAHHFGLDLEGAISAKAAFNKTRPYKHGKAF